MISRIVDYLQDMLFENSFKRKQILINISNRQDLKLDLADLINIFHSLYRNNNLKRRVL
jgi:hypothetical protein